MKPTVGITGSRGYVGSRLATWLREAGHPVVALNRRPGEGERAFELGAPVPRDTCRNLDVLVHCAWDMRISDAETVERVNVAGSTKLFEAARSAGVKRIVFISSMSAFPGCRSNYGRAKLATEREAKTYGAVVIRPGLIYGPRPGGIVGALLALARFTPVLPMVGRGDFRLHTCHEGDLCRLVEACCSTDHHDWMHEPITAAETVPRPFREIVKTLAGRRLVLLPLPWRGIWIGLKALETAGLRPRMKSDSLLGLVYSDPAPDFDGVGRSGVRFRPLTGRETASAGSSC